MHAPALSLPPERLASLLAPFLSGLEPPSTLLSQLGTYLDLLLRWNARTNLTAIRDPEHIVTRHFGESLFSAHLLPSTTRTLLDLGSGAGLPGLPLQLLRPSLSVTLAESQGKKAAFLREAVRALALPAIVHAARAELLPPSSFDCVTLRAVDNMPAALATARRLSRGPVLVFLSSADLDRVAPGAPHLPLPGSTGSVALLQP